MSPRPRIRRQLLPSIALVVALGAALGACGGDGNGGQAAATTTSTPSPTTTTLAPASAAPVADGVQEIGDALLPVEDAVTVGVVFFLEADGSPAGRGVVVQEGSDLAPRVLDDAQGRSDPAPVATDFSTQILDGEGRILLSIPAIGSEHSDQMRARIVYTERIEADMARLRIVRGDEVVFEREAAAGPPVVEIRSPAEGGRLDPYGFEVTYDVSHPEDREVTIFVDVADHQRLFASLDHDAPPDRFEFVPLPGLPRLPLEDGPGEVHVGAFDGTRAALVVHAVQIG